MWQGFPGLHWVKCRGRGLNVAWGHLGANSGVLGTEDHSVSLLTHTHIDLVMAVGPFSEPGYIYSGREMCHN